jgi:hypothetical protein
MKKLLIACVAFLALLKIALAQNIEIITHTTFHKVSWGSNYGALEDVSTVDNGGV